MADFEPFASLTAWSRIASSPGGLLRLLMDETPQTRGALVRLTGQSRATVSEHLERLDLSRLIQKVGFAPSTGGRPATQYTFDPSGRVVLGIDLGATHAALAITDLSGDVLASSISRTDISEGPDKVLSWIIEKTRELRAEPAVKNEELVGVGVGVPGPIDFSTGRLVKPPIMPGWDNVRIDEVFREHFDVPIYVDNDVNVLALGEHRFSWQNLDHLLFVKISTGIGAGIIMNGSVLRGALGSAGDLGHIVIEESSPVLCHCGNRGCLEALASGAALVKRFGDSSTRTVNDLLQNQTSKDLEFLSAIRDSGRTIGIVIASAISILNPSAVIIGGSMSQLGEPLLAGIRETVYSRAIPLSTRDLILTSSSLGVLGGARGAGMLAIDGFLDPVSINHYLNAMR